MNDSEFTKLIKVYVASKYIWYQFNGSGVTPSANNFTAQLKNDSNDIYIRNSWHTHAPILMVSWRSSDHSVVSVAQVFFDWCPNTILIGVLVLCV